MSIQSFNEIEKDPVGRPDFESVPKEDLSNWSDLLGEAPAPVAFLSEEQQDATFDPADDAYNALGRIFCHSKNAVIGSSTPAANSLELSNISMLPWCFDLTLNL